MATVEELRLKANKAAMKLRDAEEDERDKVQRPILRKMVGKCFVYQNSYGAGSPPWPLFTRIVSFDEKKMTFQTVKFQHTSRSNIEIEHRYEFNFHGQTKFGVDSRWKPISVAEYNREKKKLMRLIATLLCEQPAV